MWYFKLKCKAKLILAFRKDMPELSCNRSEEGIICPIRSNGILSMKCIKAIYQDSESGSIKEKVEHELLKCEI